jgi:hypothetical protein
MPRRPGSTFNAAAPAVRLEVDDGVAVRAGSVGRVCRAIVDDDQLDFRVVLGESFDRRRQ